MNTERQVTDIESEHGALLAMSPIASMDHVPNASEVVAPATLRNYEDNSKIGLQSIDSNHVIKT